MSVLLNSVSAVVTLVENEPESDVILDAKLEDTVVTEPLTPAAVKVLISEALDPNEPLTPAAVNVLINEAFAPNEPLISLAICAELVTTFATFEPKCSFENEPLISEAICAEPLINVFPSSVSAVVTLLASEELAAVNDPLTPAAVKVLINEAFDPSEPLIIVLEVLPNVEFHTPVVTVPTDAKLVALVIEF